jgi:toxin ParE1/3/4
MTAKIVIPSPLVMSEVETAIDYYLAEADTDTALAFIGALEAAYRFIGENPAAGSPRWGHFLELPGLRSWRLKGFPWMAFYVERSDHIDIVRLLHSKRDIPEWMTQDEK